MPGLMGINSSSYCPPSLPLGNQQFAICLWQNSNIGTDAYVGWGSSSPNYDGVTFGDASNNQFQLWYGSGQKFSFSTSSTKQLLHVCAVRTQTLLSVYLNGALLSSQSLSTNFSIQPAGFS